MLLLLMQSPKAIELIRHSCVSIAAPPEMQPDP